MQDKVNKTSLKGDQVEIILRKMVNLNVFYRKYVIANLDLSISIYVTLLANLSWFYKKYVTVFKRCIGAPKLQHLYAVAESNADATREDD